MGAWGDTANPDILQQQVASGACRTGSIPGSCLTGDGIETTCNTNRSCQPQLHFEYALPGSTPNQDIFVLGANGYTYNGPGPAPSPSAAPAILGMIDYNQFYGPGSSPSNITSPTPRVPSNAGSGGVPANIDRSVTRNGSAAQAIVPAAQGGIAVRISDYLTSFYGGTAVSQVQFCQAYGAVSGYSCNFDSALAGIRESKDWLSMLIDDQGKRVSVLGNRSLPPGGPTGQIQTLTQAPPVSSGDQSPAFALGLAPMLILGGIVFFALRHKG